MILTLSLLACMQKSPNTSPDDSAAPTDDTGTAGADGGGDDTGGDGGGDDGGGDTGTSGDDTGPSGDDTGAGGDGGHTGDTDDPGGGDTDPPEDDKVFAAMITVTDEVVGDLSCFNPIGSCASMRADESCIQPVAVSGQVEDFETDDEVEPDGEVRVYADGALSGDADLTWALSDGRFVGSGVNTCEPVLVEIELESEYVRTFHQSYTFTGSETLTVISESTAAVIPSLLGVSVDAGSGALFGAIQDCTGGALQNVQVIASLAGYGYPAEQSAHYFVADFPNRDQEATSEDGMWMLVNLPVGDYEVQAWGRVEGFDEPLLMAYGNASVAADAFTVTALQLGFCGALLPEGCLDACD